MELTLKNIRRECENNPELYGKKISDRTWQRWQLIAMSEKVKGLKYRQSMLVDKDTAILFFALARHRRLHPNVQIKWKQLCDYAKGQEWIECWRKENQHHLTCRDLPSIIAGSLKVTVPEKTLYRWARKYKLKYSRRNPLTDIEIKAWLELTHRLKRLPKGFSHFYNEKTGQFLL
jgi:hypothetical protein